MYLICVLVSSLTASGCCGSWGYRDASDREEFRELIGLRVDEVERQLVDDGWATRRREPVSGPLRDAPTNVLKQYDEEMRTHVALDHFPLSATRQSCLNTSDDYLLVEVDDDDRAVGFALSRRPRFAP